MPDLEPEIQQPPHRSRWQPVVASLQKFDPADFEITWTLAPVSKVADLVPDEDLLPCIPGSVSVIARVTDLGTSTVMTKPFQLIKGTVSPSFNHFAQLSSLLSLVSSYVSLSMNTTCVGSQASLCFISHHP